MSEFVQTRIANHIGEIILDRPKALNSLSLDMVRTITSALLAWRDNSTVRAITIRSSSERAFCAGGDIRFFYQAGKSTPQHGSALLEDFFTEEYALNHLIHFYPKPYIALMDGIVMGGGMGIAQGGEQNRVRIVTERTKMAMPEVNIGLFPDVGGSYFLARAPGQIGTYLGVTGETIIAADALHARLADVYVPSAMLGELVESLRQSEGKDTVRMVHDFAAPFANQAPPLESRLAIAQQAIDRHFAQGTIGSIIASLASDDSPFSREALAVMRKRSPLMMSVTLEQLRRGATMSVADCLRMERNMVRHAFEHGEVLEGIRSVVIDKDNAPQWSPPEVSEVKAETVARFFEPVWPVHGHPLRAL